MFREDMKMIKRFIMLIFALILMLSVISCKQSAQITIPIDPPENIYESPASAELEVSIAEMPQIIVEEICLDKLADDILKSIKIGDYKQAAYYMMATDEEVYSFIQNMTVKSYEITESLDISNNQKYFKVKFDVSKSDNAYFSAGESYWDLIVESDSPIGEYVMLFRPSDSENLNNIGRNSNKYNDRDYVFCVRFSNELSIFETTDDFNVTFANRLPAPSRLEWYMDNYGDDWEQEWQEVLVHWLIHFYLYTAPVEERSPFNANILEAYIIKTTGITDVDYTVSGRYDNESIIEICWGHGGSWQYWLPVSKEYDESLNHYTVVINYFADTALLVIAQTIEYQYSVNDDGTYRMRSLTVLFDSGLRRQTGAI